MVVRPRLEISNEAFPDTASPRRIQLFHHDMSMGGTARNRRFPFRTARDSRRENRLPGQHEERSILPILPCRRTCMDRALRASRNIATDESRQTAARAISRPDRPGRLPAWRLAWAWAAVPRRSAWLTSVRRTEPLPPGRRRRGSGSGSPGAGRVRRPPGSGRSPTRLAGRRKPDVFVQVSVQDLDAKGFHVAKLAIDRNFLTATKKMGGGCSPALMVRPWSPDVRKLVYNLPRARREGVAWISDLG